MAERVGKRRVSKVVKAGRGYDREIQEDKPSRAEAIRRLVELGLKAKGKA